MAIIHRLGRERTVPRGARRLFPLIYWIGLLIALAGVVMRFWLEWLGSGLGATLAGVGLILAARLAVAVRRFS